MHKQGSILLGLLFILAGLFFLAAQFFPAVADLLNFTSLWPVIVLGLGLVFLAAGTFNEPGMLVPGTIITTVGSILFYQNWTGNWDFWQLWLLMPGAVGLGIFLYSIRAGEVKDTIIAVGILFTVSAVLFLVFSGSILWQLWPVALILLGLFLMGKNLFFARGPKGKNLPPEKSKKLSDY